MQLKHRSGEKELLDNANIDTNDLYSNLKELDTINHLLGGYKATNKGLREILKIGKPIRTIMDIGFGGGDFIKQMSRYSTQHNKKLFFYGVDLKPDCVNYAETNLALLENKLLICDDYRNISPDLLREIDVVHCSLFLHHLKDEEIIALFKFCKVNNCIILANDLERNRFAYYSIKLLTKVFSKSSLVKNDAPISVKRGFKKQELINLLESAGYKDYSVKWSWAFRYIIIAKA